MTFVLDSAMIQYRTAMNHDMKYEKTVIDQSRQDHANEMSKKMAGAQPGGTPGLQDGGLGGMDNIMGMLGGMA